MAWWRRKTVEELWQGYYLSFGSSPALYLVGTTLPGAGWDATERWDAMQRNVRALRSRVLRRGREWRGLIAPEWNGVLTLPHLNLIYPMVAIDPAEALEFFQRAWEEISGAKAECQEVWNLRGVLRYSLKMAGARVPEPVRALIRRGLLKLDTTAQSAPPEIGRYLRYRAFGDWRRVDVKRRRMFDGKDGTRFNWFAYRAAQNRMHYYKRRADEAPPDSPAHSLSFYWEDVVEELRLNRPHLAGWRQQGGYGDVYFVQGRSGLIRPARDVTMNDAELIEGEIAAV